MRGTHIHNSNTYYISLYYRLIFVVWDAAAMKWRHKLNAFIRKHKVPWHRWWVHWHIFKSCMFLYLEYIYRISREVHGQITNYLPIKHMLCLNCV